MSDDLIFLLVTIGVIGFFVMVFFLANLHDLVRNFRRNHTKDEWYLNFNNLLQKKDDLKEEHQRICYKYDRSIQELRDVVLYETDDIIHSKQVMVRVLSDEKSSVQEEMDRIEKLLQEERNKEPEKHNYFF